MKYSKYHIDGWLTDYECATDLEQVNDVRIFSRLRQGYKGPGVIMNQWGNQVFKTIEECGLMNHPMARYQPNAQWTEVIAEKDWPGLKAYIETKLKPKVKVVVKQTKVDDRDSRILAALKTYTGPTRSDGLPKNLGLDGFRVHSGIADVKLKDLRRLK